MMTKTGLLLYLGALFAYCRYLAPFSGNDLPAYLAALACSLLALRMHRLLSKAFLFNFLFIQGMTTWVCHFVLDAQYQLITAKLVYVRGLLLGVFLVLEILAAAHLVRRYLSARRRKLFASDAFADALSAYPMLPELNKLFCVEFTIWRALLIRIRLVKERDGAGMVRLGRIEPGYGRGQIAAVAIALLAINALCIRYLPPLWFIAPLLGSVYVALLIHGERMLFGRHAIYADQGVLRIPNGIYGFVSVDGANIERVSFDAPTSRPDLSISRLSPANLHFRLAETIQIAGASVQTISLCVPGVSKDALTAWLVQNGGHRAVHSASTEPADDLRSG